MTREKAKYFLRDSVLQRGIGDPLGCTCIVSLLCCNDDFIKVCMGTQQFFLEIKCVVKDQSGCVVSFF